MQYAEAVSFLLQRQSRGLRPGLSRMRRALDQRGHPQRAFGSIIVAGTNGKGSVASMMAAMLSAAGRRVGLYTSPHLHRLVERYRIDGRPVSERALAAKVAALRPWLGDRRTPALTFFEVCTVIAMELFRDLGCELAVLEVGLGGRCDATNVVTPLVSVITHLALDHQAWLGPTLRHIAREKAGVIHRGVPVVCGVREPQPLSVIVRRARALHAPLRLIGRDFDAVATGARYRVRVCEDVYGRLRLPLAGAYQADNLACAVAALVELGKLGIAVDRPSMARGLTRVRWPGRLELIPGAPDVLCDAAHNPDACEALARHLDGLRARYRRVVLLFGAMGDKDHAAMLAALRPRVQAIIFATPPTSRATPAAALSARFGGEAVPDIEQALRRAKRRASRAGLVVVAGSIFLMAPVRASLLGLRTDPLVPL